jgi:hypothetical protein
MKSTIKNDNYRFDKHAIEFVNHFLMIVEKLKFLIFSGK